MTLYTFEPQLQCALHKKVLSFRTRLKNVYYLGAMDVNAIDYLTLTFIGLKWIASVLGAYILILLALRFSGLLTLTVCPKCAGQLRRTKRKKADKTVGKISLGILPVKRYRCPKCYWSGAGLDHKPPIDAMPEQKPA